MNRSPRVSVIVPCYNYGRFVAQAMESLLGQTLADLEVIAIDDASRDDSGEVLARYEHDRRVRVIRHRQNQGHLRSYNEALALATGRYVAIVSADDFCLTPRALERQVAVFEQHSRVGMVYSAHALVEGGQVTTTVQPAPADCVRRGVDEFRELMWGNYVLHTGTLLRREVQEELGPYDLRLPQSGDWDMWLRAAARHDVGYIAEPLYAYRLHPTNMQNKGLPPQQQADQNVLALERGFAALPADALPELRAARAAAVRHALLQTAWFDLFNGRRARTWQGLAYALRRRPSLAMHGECWRFTARALLMTATGQHTYRRLAYGLERLRGQRGLLAAPGKCPSG